MPHLISVASCSAILNFEVPRGRVNTEISAEILFVVVPKMKVSDLIDIVVGGVCNIDQLPVGEVGKKVPVGLPPLLCFAGCLAWHLEEMGRLERSCACVVVCDPGNKNDNSTVSITILGALGVIIDVGNRLMKCSFFSIPSLSA